MASADRSCRWRPLIVAATGVLDAPGQRTAVAARLFFVMSQTLLFDLDGTIIDSIQLIVDSYHHTLRVHGHPPRTDAEWVAGIGTPLRVQFLEWSSDPATLEAMIATYREFNLARHDTHVRPYPGVVEQIRRIRARGVKTGLVTSKNRQGAIRGLGLCDPEALMDVLVCADDVANPKPHPEPVEKAVALLGADPARTIYVGDSVHDMRSGRAAGVKTAAVLWGPFTREELEPTEPDFWLESPEELPSLVGG